MNEGASMSNRWEYMVLDSNVSNWFVPRLDAVALTSQLNELGKQGWEVVGMSSLEGMPHGRTRDFILVLKRATA
jgi:hypothetical protein